jgi:hypothetical protein
MAGQYRRALKAWSRPVYYLIKAALILGGGFLFFMW